MKGRGGEGLPVRIFTERSTHVNLGHWRHHHVTGTVIISGCHVPDVDAMHRMCRMFDGYQYAVGSTGDRLTVFQNGTRQFCRPRAVSDNIDVVDVIINVVDVTTEI